MTQCVRCDQVKFWFQMFSRFMGTHTETFPVCRKCAKDLSYFAVCDLLAQKKAARQAA